jgi:hypothetical protein
MRLSAQPAGGVPAALCCFPDSQVAAATNRLHARQAAKGRCSKTGNLCAQGCESQAAALMQPRIIAEPVIITLTRACPAEILPFLALGETV